MIEAVTLLLRVFEELGIRYYAGGSVASSIHGIARYTQDIDIVADIIVPLIPKLVASLGAAFYADEGQMREALSYGRAFNVIHFASGFKVDIFPLRKDEFHVSEMARSAPRTWSVNAGGDVQLMVASPEDTILEKLLWYKQGGCVSERQWIDVLGIVNSCQTDWPYVEKWASELGVADLVERLFRESSQSD